MRLRDFISHMKHNSVILGVCDLDNEEIVFNGSVGESKHNIMLLKYYDYEISSIKCYANEFHLYIRDVRYKRDEL